MSKEKGWAATDDVSTVCSLSPMWAGHGRGGWWQILGGPWRSLCPRGLCWDGVRWRVPGKEVAVGFSFRRIRLCSMGKRAAEWHGPETGQVQSLYQGCMCIYPWYVSVFLIWGFTSNDNRIMTYWMNTNAGELFFFPHTLWSFYKSFVMFLCKSFSYYSPRIFFFLNRQSSFIFFF